MPETFTLVRSTGAESPVVVEVPHAGLAVPDDVRATIVASRDDLLRDSDAFVDHIWAAAPKSGASLLVSHVSRYVVDLNRAPDDVGRDVVPDHPAPRPTQPRGVVWRVTSDGRPAMSRSIVHDELVERLTRYHAPYHAALAEELERKHRRFGRVLLVAAHSMPSRGRARERRADIVPGTRGGTTCKGEILRELEALAKDEALSLKHDEPYRGGWTTGSWGRPDDGYHALQIELSRGLYLDEATLEPNGAGLVRLRAIATRLCERFAVVV